MAQYQLGHPTIFDQMRQGFEYCVSFESSRFDSENRKDSVPEKKFLSSRNLSLKMSLLSVSLTIVSLLGLISVLNLIFPFVMEIFNASVPVSLADRRFDLFGGNIKDSQDRFYAHSHCLWSASMAMFYFLIFLIRNENTSVQKKGCAAIALLSFIYIILDFRTLLIGNLYEAPKKYNFGYELQKFSMEKIVFVNTFMTFYFFYLAFLHRPAAEEAAAEAEEEEVTRDHAE